MNVSEIRYELRAMRQCCLETSSRYVGMKMTLHQRRDIFQNDRARTTALFGWRSTRLRVRRRYLPRIVRSRFEETQTMAASSTPEGCRDYRPGSRKCPEIFTSRCRDPERDMHKRVSAVILCFVFRLGCPASIFTQLLFAFRCGRFSGVGIRSEVLLECGRPPEGDNVKST